MESPTLAERIKASRKDFGLSRADFAKLCGVDYSTVANWELGRSAPKGPTLDRLNEVMSGKVAYIQFTEAEAVLLKRVMAEGGYKTKEEFFAAALLALITKSGLK